MPPLPKPVQKWFLPQKGVAFLTEGVFEKNFQVRERIPSINATHCISIFAWPVNIGVFSCPVTFTQHHLQIANGAP